MRAAARCCGGRSVRARSAAPPPPSTPPPISRPPKCSPYIGFYVLDYQNIGGTIGICAAVTIVTLFALGATQAWIIRQNMLWQGFLMAVNGSIAAAAAFGIGRGLQEAFGIVGVCE